MSDSALLKSLGGGASKGRKWKSMAVAEVVAFIIMLVLATPSAVIIGVLGLGAIVWFASHGDHRTILVGICFVGLFALLIQIPTIGPWANGSVNQLTGFGGPLASKIHLPSFSVQTPTVAQPTTPAPPATPAAAVTPAGPPAPAAPPTTAQAPPATAGLIQAATQ